MQTGRRKESGRGSRVEERFLAVEGPERRWIGRPERGTARRCSQSRRTRRPQRHTASSASENLNAQGRARPRRQRQPPRSGRRQLKSLSQDYARQGRSSSRRSRTVPSWAECTALREAWRPLWRPLRLLNSRPALDACQRGGNTKRSRPQTFRIARPTVEALLCVNVMAVQAVGQFVRDVVSEQDLSRPLRHICPNQRDAERLAPSQAIDSRAASWLQYHPHVTLTTLRVGDHLIVTGAPSRDPGSHELVRLKEVRRPRDGWTYRVIPEELDDLYRSAGPVGGFALRTAGSGGSVRWSRRCRSRTNALMIFSAARASRSVRRPLK